MLILAVRISTKMKLTHASAFFLSALMAFLILPSKGVAQYTVNNAVNATDGVQDILLGGGVSASGITFQGTNEQIGSFSCTSCGIGLGSGIVIGSGNVNGSDGPNNSGSFSQGPPDFTDGVTDPDLVELSGMTLNNTAVLEFDFVPTGDSLFFNYVFSSEEYPEFVGSINDAFGFFLSGPGISGPFQNNAANIALVPGTSTPITINTVNSTTNSTYYNTNTNAGIQADAYTDVMTAIAEVICGETYHIKIAIGDASDGAWDSWVFLEAGSFQSNQLSLEYNAPNLSSPVDGGMYEGCEPANITFTRDGNVDEEQIFELAFSGTAQVGSDVTIGITQVVFPIGETAVTVPIIANQDAALEGLEVLTITVIGTGCTNSAFNLDINIYDLPALVVVTPDVTINCGQEAVLEPAISGGLGNYQILWENGSSGSTFSAFPNAPTSYNFTVTDTCGVQPFNGSGNVLFVQNPPIVVDAGPDFTTTCLDEINLGATATGGYGAYSFNWLVNGAAASATDSVSFIESANTVVEIIVTDQCTDTGSDIINIAYPAVPLLVNLGSDLNTTCLDENNIVPTVTGGTGTYSYAWSGNGNVNLGNTADLTLQVEENTTIALIVEDECGNTDTDEMVINIPAVPVLVSLGQDLTVTCLDVSEIIPTVSGGVGAYAYSWTQTGAGQIGTDSSLDFQTANNASVSLAVTDECGNSASDLINISVPAVAVDIELGNDLVVTCLDVSNIVAELQGGVGSYSVEWSDQDGLVGTGDNIDYQTDGTTQLVAQITDECGNTSIDAITVSVPQQNVSLDLGDDLTVLCTDEVMIESAADGGIGNYSYSWQINGNNAGNQYAISTNFIANSLVTLIVTDQCGNEASAQLNVNVPPVEITADAGPDLTATCVQASPLTASASGGIGNYSYAWSGPEGVFSSGSVTQFTTSQATTVTLTVTDQCGNSDSDQLQITVPPVPISVEVPADTIVCINSGVLLDASVIGGAGAITVLWEGFEDAGDNILVAPSLTTSYTVNVFDQCGNSTSNAVTVAVTDVTPNFFATFVDDFTIAFTNTSENADYVIWEFSDGEMTTEPNPEHVFSSVENWTATLVAVSENSCRKSITQEYFPSGALFVPNAFTPDNDGFNDVFFVKGHDIKTYEIKIFNRNGEVVYESADIETPWDGGVKGGDYFAPDGVYQYLIKAVDKRENIIEKSGAIIMIR
jgi:gliding motility-associated-like protein